MHPAGRRWIVELDGRRVRVPNLVGLRYLSELLTRPGQLVPALMLASSASAGASPERARSSVSKAIKRAIDAVDDASPAIADELRTTVNCGAMCSYVPDPQAPVTWSTREAWPAGTVSAPRCTGDGPDLPPRLTRFFGREAELAELEAMVERARLVNLVGAPGAGKTRLGVELGERLAAHFRDGAGFVDLAVVDDPAQVAGAVGRALGVRERAGRAMADQVVVALAEAELLVVLDNCEHVVSGAAELTRDLLRSCPAVRVLATSRVALGVQGEQVWAVPPLDVPTSVALFTDRARLVYSEFTLDEAGEADTEEICRQLDGVPLAIELVAAWARVLSPAQIVDRLDEALPLLGPDRGGLAPRQATMEATVEWSYRLLEPDAQRLFDRMSVFVGGFDLAAAEAVGSAGEPAETVLRGVKTLVEHSLVVSRPGSGGGMRYRMLEPVRQCGAVRLDARGETETIRRCHARHYLQVAQERAADLRAGRRGEALRDLDEDKGNFCSALRWASTHIPGVGLRPCTAVASLWEERGWVREARAGLEEKLDSAAVDGREDEERSSALALAGRLAWREWENERARERLEESLAIERRVGSPAGIARRLRALALVAMSEGDARSAVGLCEQAISLFREQGDERGLAWALISLGLAHYAAGNLSEGDDCMRQALTISRVIGDAMATADACLGLAYSAQMADSADERAHVVAGIDALREAGGLTRQPNWLVAGVALAVTEERFDAALRLAGAVESLRRQGGNRMFEVFAAPIRLRLERARRELGNVVADGLMAAGARMSLDALVAEAIAEPSGEPAGILTRREQEVAELVVKGLGNVRIAQELYISKRTVETHVDNIKRKLGVDTRQQVIAWGLR